MPVAGPSLRDVIPLGPAQVLAELLAIEDIQIYSNIFEVVPEERQAEWHLGDG